MMNQEEDSDKRSYVIMGFADWIQTPVIGSHLKYYITVPAGTSLSIPITFPDVKKPTVFQIVALAVPTRNLERKGIRMNSLRFVFL